MPTAIFLLSFFFTSLLGQERLLNKVVIGDTLKISISRIGDRYGSYDQDSLTITKTAIDWRLYSEKNGKWYRINKHALKTLKKLEYRGIKKEEHSLTYDIFKLTLKTQTTTFYLNNTSLNNFMLELKPFKTGTVCIEFL
ncbi:MAG: hypothetical protein V4547_16700 [Bacteroidota bacterium]